MKRSSYRISEPAIAILGVGIIALSFRAAAGCNPSAPMTPTEKVIVNGAISVADAACVAEAGTLDEKVLADTCHLAAEVVHALVGARKMGAARLDAAKAHARPLDDGGPP